MTALDDTAPSKENIPKRRTRLVRIAKIVVVNAAVITFFVFATLKFIRNSKTFEDA